MALPDFIVIGAAKCGTTSLRNYLDQHAEIFMAEWGEPSFFAHEGSPPTGRGPGDDEWRFVTELASYEALFQNARSDQLLGDVSPRYLFFPKSAERIHHHVPQAKLVAILRQPVDRAYSHFLMNRGRGCEPEADFHRAITKEDERTDLGWGWDWSYVGAGLYHRQLQVYYEWFPAEQIRVFLYDDLQGGSEQFFAELFTFLGVTDFRPDVSRRERVATIPRSYSVPRLLRNNNAALSLARRALPAAARRRIKAEVSARNSSAPPPLGAAERRALTARYFEDDIAALERLIGRDLHGWR